MTGAALPNPTAQQNRSSICVEDARVVDTRAFPCGQLVQRFASPAVAARATAGSFIHIQCDEHIPMRRPLSIMRADAEAGWIEVMYKIVGHGLSALGEKRIGDSASVIGPIGRGFLPDPGRPHALLIGGGVGIPPMIFLAEWMRREAAAWEPVVLIGSEIPFPFDLCESSLATGWFPGDVAGSLRLLEDQGITARLASLSDFDGTFRGLVTDLARVFLDSLAPGRLAETAIYACGPTAMLRAVAGIAAGFGVPAEVSLEEYMACAVGGCAGCGVLVHTDQGPAMKRVCVDGPVFDAASVFPVVT